MSKATTRPRGRVGMNFRLDRGGFVSAHLAMLGRQKPRDLAAYHRASGKGNDDGKRDQHPVKADFQHHRQAAHSAGKAILQGLHGKRPGSCIASRSLVAEYGSNWACPLRLSQVQNRSLVRPNSISVNTTARPKAMATFMNRSDGGRPVAHS